MPWYCVKNPSSHALSTGITWEAARAQEGEFFAQTAPWSTLEWAERQRLGTDKLTRRLSDILSDLIARR
jgi:hypothetical protein